MAKEFIKVHKYYYPVLLTVCVVGFLIAVVHSTIVAGGYIRATKATTVPLVRLNGPHHISDLRGAVFYDKDRYIPDAILVKADTGILSDLNVNKNWLGVNGPRYYLSELPYPYKLWKQNNTDTVSVEKNGRLLKFIMLKAEEPSGLIGKAFDMLKQH